MADIFANENIVGDLRTDFEILNSINVNGHTEKKNGLTYLSWAWAWTEIKKAFPEAVYTIYENENGWNYFTDGRTCWVKTGVKIGDIEYIEYLPIMDFKNKSIPLEAVTSTDVNKAIQRSLTKACARHGLGLYIYAGEDLPEGEEVKSAEPSRADIIEDADNRAKALAYINKHLDLQKKQQLCACYKVKTVTDMTGAQCKHYLDKLAEKGIDINE